MADRRPTNSPPTKSDDVSAARVILTINGGSSSIKFALFTPADPPKRLFTGQIERIGQPGTKLTVTPAPGNSSAESEIPSPKFEIPASATFAHAADKLIAYLHERLCDTAIAGIGHRVVHGGAKLLENQLIDGAMVAELRRMQPLDLAHLPREIALIEAFGKAYPNLPQVACFDTAFHRDLPRVARLLPIPRLYFDECVQRFGFHGLYYTYLMQRLAARLPALKLPVVESSSPTWAQAPAWPRSAAANRSIRLWVLRPPPA